LTKQFKVGVLFFVMIITTLWLESSFTKLLYSVAQK